VRPRPVNQGGDGKIYEQKQSIGDTAGLRPPPSKARPLPRSWLVAPLVLLAVLLMLENTDTDRPCPWDLADFGGVPAGLLLGIGCIARARLSCRMCCGRGWCAGW